ncbi:non-heme iron oxygenase ferredoxin subunit [Arthrobacter sp. AK01]|uniref:non-heme iron oxygenase ferredoxin subunit n=1 Tax=Micrococcaceae TaxID=1268 RepID=UPI001E3A2C84|nr:MULTISPECIES: non-heme iron oxygenase ferredoxin subunit [Micrococcaceae]MCD4851285.1 non-heme iron oxygenase ferredoxin subunit [Arthrobacter sp. AK01]MCP1411431.1 3-phenylpropionate/trans-cinnamate dioxygenase ferredoxin subunit [Paenarthrobacter sp. A20]
MNEAISIGTAGDIEQGEATVVPAGTNGTDQDIAVFHAEDGNFYALNDTCTHETASLADGWIEGTEVECPVHSAKFCLKSGSALCLPATLPARTHMVEVRDGELLLYPNIDAVV